MTVARETCLDDPESLPRMPGWVTSGHAETLEDGAFLSGAALAHLHLVLNLGDLPQSLVRDRLALGAAETCMTFAGRSERAGDLRDAVHLMRLGDLPGPAGEVYLCWYRAVERPVAVKALHRALPEHSVEQLTGWLDRPGAGQGAPVSRAASVLEAVMTQAPRNETAGLIFADAALAQVLGCDHLVPLLALGLTRGDLRQRGDALRIACHRAVTKSANEAVRLAHDLARKTMRL